MEKLVTLFNEIFAGENPDTADGHLKAVFSGKRRKSLEYNKVTMRPVILGDRLVYQAEYTFPKKVTHTNLEAAEAADFALSLVEKDFKQVNIFTASEEIQVLASKPQNPRITSKNLMLYLHVCLSFLTTKPKIRLSPTAFHATFS